MALKRKASPDYEQSDQSFYTGLSVYVPSHIHAARHDESPVRPYVHSPSVSDRLDYRERWFSREPWESERRPSELERHNAGYHEPRERRKRFLQSLKFEQMEARHATIRSAYAKTCEWLLDRPEYRQWHDTDTFSDHNGLLWVKGKPATGKSTITKFAYRHAVNASSDTTVIAFFFNARGQDLERDTPGMYRSLLFQLLNKIPALQSILDSCTVASDELGDPKWSIEELKTLFTNALIQLGRRPLICFVDALDECEEDQVREMVRFFEQLGQLAFANDTSFRIWFSSRHYPYISIKKGIMLKLEEQEGHDQDIATYLENELRIERDDLAAQIKNDLLQKASGIFLWIVLVVPILNKEYDRGRIHALRQRLSDIPADLEDLFDDILMREGLPQKEQVLCLQWVLYAKRPLKPQELYFAILAGYEPNFVPIWDRDMITEHDMTRYILDCSKGLVEEAKTQPITIQFIHESVREFFLTGSGYNRPFFAPADTFPARSHDQLKRCCRVYYEKADVSVAMKLSTTLPNAFSQEAAELVARANKLCPFLDYAVQNILYHSEIAETLGCSQAVFLEGFNLSCWISANNILQSTQAGRFLPDASILYVLAEKDLASLILIEPGKGSGMTARGGWRKDPLIAAQAAGNEKALQALLTLFHTACKCRADGSTITSKEDIQEASSWLLQHRGTLEASEGQDMLLQAAAHGGHTLAKILLTNPEVNVNVTDWNQRTPLVIAIEHKHTDFAELLLKRDDVILDSGQLKNILQEVEKENGRELLQPLKTHLDQHFIVAEHRILLTWAALCGNLELVRLALARYDFCGDASPASRHWYLGARTPLWQAVASGDSDTLIFLLGEFPLHVDAMDRLNQTPLSRAAQSGHTLIFQELLAISSKSINTPTLGARTPLHYAAAGGFPKIVELLLAYDDINVNVADSDGMTPLHEAALRNQVAIAAALIKHGGVDINANNKFSRTPLMYAAMSGHDAIVIMLLGTHGIDVTVGRITCIGREAVQHAIDRLRGVQSRSRVIADDKLILTSLSAARKRQNRMLELRSDAYRENIGIGCLRNLRPSLRPLLPAATRH